MTTYITTYNFPDLVSGDTFLGVQFELKDALGSAINIAGATIVLTTKRDSNTLSTDAGTITITDGQAVFLRYQSR